MKLKPIVTAYLWLAVAAAAQPANDDFADRLTIVANSGPISGTLSNATSEANEPLLPGISSGQTAWWSWLAPSNGILTISATASNFNPLVTVFNGDQLANLSLVASNNYLACYSDGDCGCHWRMRDEVTFHVFKGQNYQISVDSPIITDASMEWTQSPAIVEYGPFYDAPLEVAPPDGPPALPIGPEPVPIVYGIVFTTNTIPGDSMQLNLNFVPAPSNDDFAQALVWTGSRLQRTVSNSGATKETGEPNHGGNPGGSSVWYSWKAPASGRVTLSTNNIAPYAPPAWQDYGVYGLVADETIISIPYSLPDCGSLIDQNPPPVFYPLLAAYTGTEVNALTPTDSLPVGLAAFPYAIEFDVVQGRLYHIAFDGNMGTTNEMTLCLALTRPAINDTFANRIPLQGVYLAASGYNAGAVKQSGAPNLGNGSTGKIAWWSWTAPVAGPVSIDLSGSDYTFPMAVFTGAKLSSLSMAASGSGSVSFTAKVGQVYQIAVGDAGGLTGEIKMVLQAPVVTKPLLSVQRSVGDSAMLNYEATAGQVLELQYLKGGNWNNLQSAMAHHNAVDFFVKAAPKATGPVYRAIVVNYISP